MTLTRRDFIKSTAAATALVVAGPLVVATSEELMVAVPIEDPLFDDHPGTLVTVPNDKWDIQRFGLNCRCVQMTT